MDTPRRLTFHKSERLRHKALVDPLFKSGKSFYAYPLRIVFRPLSGQQLADSFKISVPEGIAPLQVLITVPKKKRRHAVDRVLMRRRIREAYRLSRLPLRRLVEDNPELRTVSIAILYLADKNIDSASLSAKLDTLLSKVASSIRESI